MLPENEGYARSIRVMLIQAPSRVPRSEGPLGSGKQPSKGESPLRFYNRNP